MGGRRFLVTWCEEDTAEALKAAYQGERDLEFRTRLHGLWLLRSGWRLLLGQPPVHPNQYRLPRSNTDSASLVDRGRFLQFLQIFHYWGFPGNRWYTPTFTVAWHLQFPKTSLADLSLIHLQDTTNWKILTAPFPRSLMV